MLEGDFAFVTLDFYISESLRTSLAKKTWSLSWEKMLEIFEGLITLSVKKPNGLELQNITKWLNRGLQDMPVFQNLTAVVIVLIAIYIYDISLRFCLMLTPLHCNGEDSCTFSEALDYKYARHKVQNNLSHGNSY